MRFTAATMASVLAVVGVLGSFAPLLAEGAGLDGVEQDLVARINAFRAARGLATLTVSDTLTAAAKWMSADMGARNYFAHTSLDGRSPTQCRDAVVAAGERTTLVVALTNTGSRGWYRGVADQQANLGTSEPQDAERPDLAADWLSANRLTSTTTEYVGPGEVGWFEFTLRAPTTAGDYRVGLRGVVDGAAWLEDDGIFFVIHVLPSIAASGSLSFVR